MLILTRYLGQSFNIYLDNGEVISVVLIDQPYNPNGPCSKIGIEAPRKYNIVRTELIGRPRKQPIEEPCDEACEYETYEEYVA